MQARNVAVFALVLIAFSLTYLVLSSLVQGSAAKVGAAAAANPAYVFTVNGKAFDISMVAANDSAREKGLMNATITNATMMIFVFPSLGSYPFWMENTYSNLDMMWLNVSGGSGSVVYLVRNAASCVGKGLDWCESNTYYPTAEANYVIEAKAGFAESNNITVGTRVGLSGIG
jgi:uncharacterized membrane protein (UPF0127 family)